MGFIRVLYIISRSFHGFYTHLADRFLCYTNTRIVCLVPGWHLHVRGDGHIRRCLEHYVYSHVRMHLYLLCIR